MPNFSWIEFYTAFATRLLDYKDDRITLIEQIQEAYAAIHRRLPNLGANGETQDIDPFTVFSLFNRRRDPNYRMPIIASLNDVFNVSEELPDGFDGAATLKAQFYRTESKEQDINNLWILFEAALSLAEKDTPDTRDHFISAFNQAPRVHIVRWSIIRGLSLIRPERYLNLDDHTRPYLRKLGEKIGEDIDALEQDSTGNVYLRLGDTYRRLLSDDPALPQSFPELSYRARNPLEQEEPAPEDGVSPEKDAGTGTEETPEDGQGEKTNGSYTEKDFLAEVFVSKDFYKTVTGLLREKKNIILQGAPGVGKTYLARRLAYAMMGRKDEDRIRMVQFHQSYSYEDFIMGYRPTETGFELRNGTFYSFCKLAENDPTKKYFFIIDEINRGNLSRIFGELFMLIEHDKRGAENSLKLLYSGEPFSVPENVFFIGMMNTADRSLAMLDYALRRRFAFVDLKPAFESDRFREYQKKLNSSVFDKLIECVKNLNEEIAKDDSLGEGFRLGHSFFCNLKPGEATPEKLSRIVEYELIPLLKEYWFDEPGKVENWRGTLRDAVRG